MRVGLIAPPWIAVPPPAYGGTELVIDVLARGLARRGHDVLLVTTGDATCPVPRSWVFPRGLGTSATLVGDELTHVEHAYAVVGDCDVVHDHTQLGPLYGHHTGAPPAVTTCHGPLTPPASALYAALAGTVPLIAISHRQRAAAPAVPVVAVIHHGIDVERVPFGTGAGGYLAFLGRMSPDKGVRTAIGAARAAGFPLRIAAKMRDPEEVRYFRGEVEPLLGAGVEYVGEVSGHEKERFLGEAVALLNPIRWDEPFGLVMIESLACGTPVITSHRGAAPEIVEHGRTGWLCDDAAALIAAIRSVDRIDRAACREAVARRFSAERLVDDHLAVYGRILAAGTTGAVRAS